MPQNGTIPPPGINTRKTRTNVWEETREMGSTAGGFAIDKKQNLKINGKMRSSHNRILDSS